MGSGWLVEPPVEGEQQSRQVALLLPPETDQSEITPQMTSYVTSQCDVMPHVTSHRSQLTPYYG